MPLPSKDCPSRPGPRVCCVCACSSWPQADVTRRGPVFCTRLLPCCRRHVRISLHPFGKIQISNARALMIHVCPPWFCSQFAFLLGTAGKKERIQGTPQPQAKHECVSGKDSDLRTVLLGRAKMWRLVRVERKRLIKSRGAATGGGRRRAEERKRNEHLPVPSALSLSLSCEAEVE